MTTSLRIAAVCTIAFCAWQSVTSGPFPNDNTAAQIDAGLRAYRALTTDLPAHGRIGFVPTSENETVNSANLFVAQYALAPRLVLRVFDPADVRFVVTGVDAPADIANRAPLHDFEFVGVREFGVRIFRKSH